MALLATFDNAGNFETAATLFQRVSARGAGEPGRGLEARESNILAGDMATSCKGALARTRYVVVLAYTSADQSCSNSVFNEFVDPTGCAGDAGVAGDNGDAGAAADEACVACRLTLDTLAIKKLAAQSGVGEVDILPIYYTQSGGTPDPVAQAAALAIATAAGSTALVTDETSLTTDLEALDLGSISQPVVLRRVYAWNRNSIARNGQLLVDSDGDGLSDDDELNLYHTDPRNYDTDGDGLGDGVEIKMGLDPLTPNVLQGCDPTQDDDGDRLNDCEEQILGTDPCQFDTDGDGFSDLVEVLRGTNPLVPENTLDSDRDGYANVDELAEHTDPFSIDLAFRADHAYFGTTAAGAPTADGRNCYDFTIGNVGLVATQAIPNPPFNDIVAGTNDIYVYLEMGFADRLTGEVSSLYVQPIVYAPPALSVPDGTIAITPDEFVLGN